MRILLATIIFFATSTSFAQFTNFRPTGVMGYAGVGFVTFDISAPTGQNLEFDDGVYTALGGEKGFGVANLYLTMSLNYLKSDGKTNYIYTTNGGATTYTSNGTVPFNIDLFQAGLGLKLKLIDEGWFKPYVEAGGLFGYFQMKYTNLSTSSNLNVVGADTGFKRDDSLFDFGFYGEAGLEISFSQTFGLKAGMRMTKNKTKEFDTLDNQKVEYDSQVYYLGLLKKF